MLKWSYLSLALFILCACQRHYPGEPHDPAMDLHRDDFLTLLDPSPQTNAAEDAPSLEPVTLPPVYEEKGPVVSLTMTKPESLQDIFQEIAKQSDLDLLLDPEIEGTLIYNAHNRPLARVIQDICDLKKLRARLDQNMLKVEKDLPYLKTYDLSFLTLVRESNSSIGVNTSMLGFTEGNSGKNGNGSHSYLSGSSKNNFWEELAENLTQILEEIDDDEELLRRYKDAEEVADLAPDFENPVASNQSKKAESSPKKSIEKSQKKPFTINRQAGLVTVRGKEYQHKIVADLLKRIKKSLSTQILIEAKVVEIKLKDEYRSGINWNSAFGGAVNFQANLADVSRGSVFSGITSPQDTVRLNVDKGGLTSVLNLMESFGTVRTLSSPRLTVMNNQTAILKVADNLVFFRVKYDRQYYRDAANQQSSNIIAESTISTVPVGFIMSVQPAIDLESDEVILTLRPTITRVTGRRSDPAVQLMAKDDKTEVHSEIPIISVREMDSVLRISSGQVAVLGGLMQESSENIEAGVPGLKETPLSFFTQSKSDDHSVVELVIFIKATIVRDAPIGAADQRVYKEYFKDPRPLTF